MVNENEDKKTKDNETKEQEDADKVEERQEEAKGEETARDLKEPGPESQASSAEQDKAEGEKAGEEKAEGGKDEEEAEDFGELFEKSLKKPELDQGEIIRGVVVGVTRDYAMVDIGDKSEGQVALDEFKSLTDNAEDYVGRQIDVLVESKEDEDGIIRLSMEKAAKRIIWDEIEEAYRNETPVSGKIAEKVKGGLMVDIGINAFLPSSQADVRPIRSLDKMIGIEDKFVIIKFNRKRGNVVVSRRAYLERELKEKREETLASLEKDQVIKGVVKNLTEYGAFIDLGGIDGLLHITDMSYGRIGHPSEIMRIGDEIAVKVLRFNRETEKVSLGLKQIMPDPWDNVEKKYPVGTIVIGSVVSVTDYGAFVELEKGVEGLVHVSEMSWSKKRVHPSKVVEPGQEVEAKVLDIDVINRRISLSIKQAQPNPWDMLEIKYPVGTKLRGTIRNITNFGVFVGVEEGIDGLVHISDLSWTRRVKHPSELFKKGQEVDAVVLNIDKEHERFSLGIKQAQPDPWESVPAKYKPGEDVVGKVVNITDFGVFVELEEAIEGLIHISELSHQKVKDPSEMVQPGQEITAEILNVDISERKIRLSVKALERTEDQAAYQKHRRQEGDGTSKLGELIQDKLSKMRMPEFGAVTSRARRGEEKEEPEEETGKKEEQEPAEVSPMEREEVKETGHAVEKEGEELAPPAGEEEPQEQVHEEQEAPAEEEEQNTAEKEPGEDTEEDESPGGEDR